ncbi:ABC transporter permease [Myxococcus sp. K15C18031901]|uniref:ABC transporter permease n=1 Tax=Myxococcus dinghuensis TaxID=2906761 RepID=UPI0020A741A2|nr:ABC transporter permease [Myxococcus dinghuensis]MCP3102260.1 ABC transporter permease [Myxococcus dinghuensis]
MSAPMQTAEVAPAPVAVTSSRWEQWSDRVNPLVIKEIRQGLRTRVFWVCFGLMLMACTLLALLAYVQSQDARDFSRAGRDFFLAFFCCLSVVHFFVIPYTAYRSLAREREEETWVLLVLTGLGARRILRGKVSSFLVQAALYASAVGPFLLFSYYLNGISLPSVLVVLGLGGAWLVFLTLVSVCAATLADGRMGRALVHFMLLAVLVVALGQGVGISFMFGHSGDRVLRDDDFGLGLATALMVMLTHGWLLFETAVARLSLPTENYSRGPRLAWGAQWLLGLVGGGAVWWFAGRSHAVAEAFGVAGALQLGVVGLFVATDVDGQARPLRAATRPWSLLRPGAVRGFRLTVLLLVLWGAAWVVLQSQSGMVTYNAESMRMAMAALPLYGLLYLSGALLMGRLPRSNRAASPVAVRVLFALAVVLGSALPPLLALLVGVDADDPLINLLNPLVGTVNFGTQTSGGPKMTWGLLQFLMGVTFLAVFAADRVLVERERQAHQP